LSGVEGQDAGVGWELLIVLIPLLGLWQWMLGWLLTGGLVLCALRVGETLRQPYQGCLMAVVVTGVMLLAVEFWFRCMEFEETSGANALHIGGIYPAISFGLGVFAAFIGAGLVAVARKIRRPPPTSNDG
jgi:hypothetical protein